MEADKSRRYLSENRAATYLGISAKTLQRHRYKTGLGPKFIKLAGRILYDIHDCDSWMEDHKCQSTSEYIGE